MPHDRDEKWPSVPEGLAVVLWRCSSMGEIDRPARSGGEIIHTDEEKWLPGF